MNIRKSIYSSLVISMLLSAGGCVDLNYNELTTNDEEWVYDSPIYGVEKLVNDIYAQLTNGFENNWNGALLASATDEADFALINSGIHTFYNGGWSANNPMPDYWKNNYTAIHEANNFLEKLDKIDLSDYIYSVTEQTSYEELRARFELFAYEIRALRAYYYFELVRAYGDVPLVLTTLSIQEANSVSRKPARQVMDFIVAECDAIAEFLPISYRDEMSQHLGRTSRPFVMALKARTLLYAASPLFNPSDDTEIWRKAAEANKYVIDHAEEWGIKMGTYAALWGNDSFTNPELIFAVAKTADNTFERQNYPVGVEGGSSGNCPTQSLVDMYEYQSGDNTGKTFGEVHPGTVDVTSERPYDGLDPRFAMTVVKNGDFWPLNANQQSEIQCFTNGFNAAPKVNATPTGYYLRKYVDGNSDLTPNVDSKFRHAWIIMRLPEFYLNYAECVYRITGDAEAKGDFGMSANEAINVVRGRSDVQMPPFSGNPVNFVSRYERERLAEFAFEDHRFWDVRRWKKGSVYFADIHAADIRKEPSGKITLGRKKLSRVWDEKYNLFPVPNSEIMKNHRLTQNTGW